MAPGSQVTLCIIAGGRASRLGGVPKGLLRFEGVTILERQLQGKHLFADVLLVTNDPTPYASFKLRTVGDTIPGKGAPGGVHAALVQARTPWILALGCDMPFVTLPVLSDLLGECSFLGAGVCFEVHGRLEPLLGLYRASSAGSWEKSLVSNPSFAQVFARMSVRVLPQSRLEAVDPQLRATLNVNSPEGLARFGGELPLLNDQPRGASS